MSRLKHPPFDVVWKLGEVVSEYAYEELTDMHLICGDVKGNGRKAQKLYEQRFPSRRIPSHPTFSSVDRQELETGSFAI
ncbi:hypothetical protein TNCV_2363781 [Trichonephila clavipes]|nr:hypothetical protein TNCV_2363781 [Trichonephila clavipes]